jgi:hypothetical protein
MQNMQSSRFLYAAYAEIIVCTMISPGYFADSAVTRDYLGAAAADSDTASEQLERLGCQHLELFGAEGGI